MSRLYLSLLGPPEISLAGETLKFPTRKAVALLIYLCVEGGFHAREKLIALLWPESDETKGRGSLRLTLTYLRNALRGSGTDAAPLVSNLDAVGFSAETEWEMDLGLLQGAMGVLRYASGTLNVEQQLLLQQAVESYRGDFLEGFSLEDAPDYDNWISTQREIWHNRTSLVFDRLSQVQLDGGHLVDAVEVASRWVAHDPLNEGAHRRLIQIHMASGERGAAHRAYEACCGILERELNAEPSPETVALADRIQHFMEPELVVPGLLLARQNAVQPTIAAPLVGRSDEHLALVSLYRTMRRGECKVVVIEGEAGIGKTRLAGEFLRWAAAQGADIWEGRSFESGGRLPYQPIVQMLRHRMERENAPDDLLADLWLAELSQLLPELRERYPDLPSPLVGNADFMGTRLFEAVARLGNSLAALHPLILFLDDVQWTDAGTRGLLHYLAQRWTEGGIPTLLLFTVRQEAKATMPDLREWLAGLERDVALARLPLTPLTRSDLHELVRAFTTTVGDEEKTTHQLGDWLLAETGGSPFFIAEMLHMLQEQEILAGEFDSEGYFIVDAAATWQRLRTATHLPLSPTVRSVILTRMERLSEKAQALLLAGAVIGQRCSFELLCKVSRLDEFEALPALEDLLNSRLLLEGKDAARPLNFAHDNIRQVTYAEASTTRRRLYHRQALAALEGSGAPPAELFFHAAAANLSEPAFRHAVDAGDAALALHAFTDAVVHYGSALEWTPQVETTPKQRCYLCTQYGRALELSGRYIDALAHYESMVQVAEKSGDRHLALAGLMALGSISATASELSDFSRAEELGERALALARELEDRVAEAKIHWSLLNVYRMTHRYQQAQHAGEYTLLLAQELGLREQQAYAANDLVYVFMTIGNITRTVEMAEMATRLWRELGNRPMLTDSVNSHAHLMTMQGEYKIAMGLATEALEVSQSIENKWSQSNSLTSLSLIYWQRMNVGQALAATEKSIDLGRMTGFAGAIIAMGSIQALIRLALGDYQRARTLAETALGVAERNIPLLYTSAAGALALVAQSEGKYDEAGTILAGIPEGADLDAFNHFLFETALCQQLLSQNNFAGANILSTKVLDFLEERNLRMFVPHFLYLKGQALLGLGEPESAQRTLKSAVAMIDEIGGRWLLWEIAALLADLADADGDETAAKKWRSMAQSTVRSIASTIDDPTLQTRFFGQPGMQKVLATPDLTLKEVEWT